MRGKQDRSKLTERKEIIQLTKEMKVFACDCGVTFADDCEAKLESSDVRSCAASIEVIDRPVIDRSSLCAMIPA